MKKYAILWTSLIISLIIVLGFAGTVLVTQQTYRKLLEDDIENISIDQTDLCRPDDGQ